MKMTAIKEPIIPTENAVYKIMGNKRGETKPKCKIGDLVRTSSIRKTFYKEIV